ncbi:galactose/methyl galactoside ABC transporter ATP-binding protein MglA [Brachyspira innocens]|uniref:Ribose/galactose/methyl galactoside import ATP-binding protein n=1 Tax=Brachyspira innocens TaxID=13264 RepID=A0ABT8YZ61_9SPIR|nr:galactose/methyl galactoside ABC transporter ATP-binding protein MglA [Brachyspira innocens]MDO6993879.1 galactose/methyl galactoside ABC transporter ATP-binding protein MglA [Brachyspira innocens]MDO7021171.1 galactose/methyl galactoside ABC transporter ATP-binding protein MglA [Brachyspira innocens]
MDNKKIVLEMKGISKSFPGVKALDDVKLTVREGEVVALMGENGAGKSTLMKCLFGIYRKDSGEIFLDGKEVNFTSPKQALNNGVAMVHQELNQVRQRNIQDNIWLGKYPTKMGVIIDEKKMYDDTKAIFDDLEIPLDPRTKVSTLSVSEMQMVEIAKAVSYNSKILVLDEPTSSLTEKEVAKLFKIIKKLQSRGVGMIYISHKMEEILQISDEVTIMRDGKYVATTPAKELTTDMIIKQMVGRDLTNRFPEKTNTPSENILEIKDFTAFYQPSLKDVNFNVRKGEVFGIAGLVGAKRTEVLESIFGMRTLSSGHVIKMGEEVNNSSTRKAIKNGFALVTEERRQTGIFSMLSINFNSTIANIDHYKNKFGFLENKKMREDTKWVIDSMQVKTPSEKTAIQSLSGGNQQKVILGRWLLSKPDILMLDEPTRGIDVGAKYDIYRLIIDLATVGKAVIVVSSEMPELLGITDRIMVMSNGRVAGIVETKNTNQEEIMALSAKYL